MGATLDTVMTEIGAIAELVKNHKHDPQTLDNAVLEAAVKNVMAQQQVIRRGELPQADTLIGADGRVYHDPIVRDGKFAGMRRSELQFAAAFLQRAASMRFGTVRPPSDELLKAAMSTTDAVGGDLVPTNLAAELWQDFFTASRVASTLGAPVAMPSDPFLVPFGLGAITFGKGTQNTAATAQAPATDQATMTTTELLAEINWSYTLDEDAVVAMLPALRARLGIAGAEYIDAFILNADSTNAGTGNINLDDADPTDTLYYISAGQDGIRHVWAADATGQAVNAGGDALTDADILAALVLMGKYAVDPGRLALVCDISTYLKGLLNLDGVQTLDKYGNKAVLLTGELGSYRGIPIVPSASHPLCEADGKVSTTAGNNTLGSISLYHRDFWQVGFRRKLMIEVDKSIQSRSFILVASFRIAVAAGVTSTRSAITHTAGIRNILVA